MAVSRVKLHNNQPQRIPTCRTVYQCWHCAARHASRENTLDILYTFLPVYTSIYIYSYNIHVSSVYSVLFADSEQQDTLQSPRLSCPATFACWGIYDLPPKTTGTASLQLWPSPPLWNGGPGVSPPKNFWILIIILVHSCASQRNLLTHNIYKFCCNSFTVCNSLQAKKLKS